MKNTTQGGATSIETTVTDHIYFIISLIVVILNLVEIIIISRTKQKKIFQITLLSLSISDLLFGIISAINIILQYLDVKQFDDVYESTRIFQVFFVSCSILHLTWITLDRYLAVHRPLQYRSYITVKRTHRVITIIWISTLVLGVALFTADELKELAKSSTESNVVRHFVPLFKAALILFADVVFILCYGFIIKYYKCKKKLTENDYIVERKLILTCLLTTAVFVCLATPYAIISIMNYKNQQHWLDIFLLLNSAMNTIVYFFLWKK